MCLLWATLHAIKKNYNKDANIKMSSYTLIIIFNLFLIIAGIFIYLRKYDKINFKLILFFYIIFMVIYVFDIFSTAYCYNQFGSMDGEVNPIPKYVVTKLGYLGFFLLLIFAIPLVFVSFITIYYITNNISSIKIIDGDIIYILIMSILVINYLTVPIHNFFICSF